MLKLVPLFLFFLSEQCKLVKVIKDITFSKHMGFKLMLQLYVKIKAVAFIFIY